jgi:transposase
VGARAIGRLRAALALFLEDESNRLSALMRELLGKLAERLRMLEDSLRQYDQRIARFHRQDEGCQWLIKVEGVDPLVATPLVGAIGSARQSTNGRELGAWLALVQREYSSGNRTMLPGISTRGNRYLRTLLIHGPQADARGAERKRDAGSISLSRLSPEGEPTWRRWPG